MSQSSSIGIQVRNKQLSCTGKTFQTNAWIVISFAAGYSGRWGWGLVWGVGYIHNVKRGTTVGS
jgi:hypothetical protein